MARQEFGQLSVYMATHDHLGKQLPKAQWHPIIDDGRCGELYVGDGAGARALAADLLAAADAYDALDAENGP